MLTNERGGATPRPQAPDDAGAAGPTHAPWRIRARRLAFVWGVALLAQAAIHFARSRAQFWAELFTPLSMLVAAAALLGSWRALRGRTGADRRRWRDRRARARRSRGAR